MTIVNGERLIVGVGVVVIDRGRILVVKRGGAPWRGQWAVPGGKLEFGESLRSCAVREVKEETGLDVELGRLLWVGDGIGDGDPPDHHVTLIDFSARVVGGTLVAGDDALDAAFIPLGEVRALEMAPSMFAMLDEIGFCQDERET